MDENQTTQEHEIDFSEFYEADGGDDGYQTEETTNAEENPVTDPGEQSEDPEQEEDGAEGTDAPEEQKNDSPAEPSNPENQENADNFTIKVNKEERTVSREEVISLAQKGADYDRVKQQLADSRQETEAMRAQFEQNRGILELLDLVVKRVGSTPEKLVESMYYSFMKGNGVSESEAKEALRADKLEKKLTEMESQTSKQKNEQDEKANRAAREIAEFRKEFPDVELGEELVGKLMADVQSGLSLTSAYRKMEAAKKDAEIAELQRKLTAAEQNKKNRAASPGSQKDSGGNTKREAVDDFIDAL